MPAGRYHRIALAQISVNPAYVDQGGASYLHEPLFPSEDRMGLYTLGGLDEVAHFRFKIASAYVNHARAKLQDLMGFAHQHGVELLVLPEYSVPSALLQFCQDLADRLGVVIVAGSHIVTTQTVPDLRAVRIRGGHDGLVGRAVCPVFVPNAECLLFQKLTQSKWESSLAPGVPCDPVLVKLAGEEVSLEVLICLDALQDSPLPKERRKRDRPSLVAIPSLTPSTALFYERARLLLAGDKATLFANVAEFGGSRIFARAERTHGWMTTTDGTEPLPQQSEALVVAEIDLAAQYDVRKSIVEHFPVRETQIFPFLYPESSPHCREYAELIQELASKPPTAMPSLRDRLTRFTTLEYALFPRLLQTKLAHFLGPVVSTGLADDTLWRRSLDAVVITSTCSTDALRWELCGSAFSLVTQLTLSADYKDKTDELAAVYGYLAKGRNQIGARLGPEAATSESMTSVATEEGPSLPGVVTPFEPPFYDRDSVLDAVRRFIESSAKSCLVLAGMRGIGKSSIAREIFREVIPPSWRRIWIQLTEGTSYARLLADFAYRTGIRVPLDLALETEAQQLDIAQNITLHFSQAPRLTLVLDDFQYLLSPTGEFADDRVATFLTRLLLTISSRKNKVLLVTRNVPTFAESLRQSTELRYVPGLELKDSEDLFKFWLLFERQDLPAHQPQGSERLLSTLGGHPLAIKIAAKLWASTSLDERERDLTIFRRLRETIVPYVLERVPLELQEDEFLRFASIFRLPVRREAFSMWKADEGSFLLDSLLGRSLLETDGERYHLHPLIREHFYISTPFPTLRVFHRIAGAYFLSEFDRARTSKTAVDPALLGEAVHHYLCAGDREKVKSFGLYRHELRPVALAHYRKRDYDLAVKDYQVLVALDPNDHEAHFHLALIYARTGKGDDAENHFGRAMQLKPRGYWILQGYAHVMISAGRVEEAEDLLRQAEDIKPDHSATLTDLGRLRARLRDEESAEDYFRRAIDADVDNTFAYVEFARFLKSQGRFEEGLDMALAALETNPTDPRNRELVREFQERVRVATEMVKQESEPSV